MFAPTKISLRTILGITFIVALASVAIGQGSRVWAVAFLNLVFLLLMIALVGACLRRGPARAWWLGFFIGGSGYLLLLRFGHRSLLLLNILIGQRYPHLFDGEGELIFIGKQPFEPGVVTGHSLVALVIAAVAGYLGCYFHSGRAT